MTTLVTYASRHGATAGIAERVALTLEAQGVDTELLPVDEVGDVSRYDAFVVGSAAYMFHWMKEATRFVRKNRDRLSGRPLWLFSSGPLGHDLVDEKGNDILEVTRPKEFEEFAALHPRDTKVFFGARDPEAPARGMAERFLDLMPASRDALPTGDFRDWDAIEAWADEIAAVLRPVARDT